MFKSKNNQNKRIHQIKKLIKIENYEKLWIRNNTRYGIG